MNFAISNNYSPNFMAKKPPRVSKHIGDGVKSSAVDFYKKQGFENVPPKDLLFIPKTEIK